MDGKQTIIVRKTVPKCDVPFKCYIYCTASKPYLYRIDDDNNFELANELRLEVDGYVKDYNAQNGKVIGEFVCDKVDKYTFSYYDAEYRVTHVEQNAMYLNQPELTCYGKGETLYGWHISDLKIYDKSRELSGFVLPCRVRCENCKNPLYYERKCEEKGVKCITRPPQSWMYVEEA